MGKPFRPMANAALAELMAADAELEDRPFGGWAGEMATPSREPAPQPPAPFVIPPPPWAEGGEPEPPPELPVLPELPNPLRATGKGASSFDERIGTPNLDTVKTWQEERA